jgi:hypothetical protein
MIAQEIQDEYETLHTDIEELIGIAILWKWRYSCKMKKIVPEFKSMNSLMRSWINSAEFVMVCILSFDSF